MEHFHFARGRAAPIAGACVAPVEQVTGSEGVATGKYGCGDMRTCGGKRDNLDVGWELCMQKAGAGLGLWGNRGAGLEVGIPFD